jgi:hypothetical protein
VVRRLSTATLLLLESSKRRRRKVADGRRRSLKTGEFRRRWSHLMTIFFGLALVLGAMPSTLAYPQEKKAKTTTSTSTAGDNRESQAFLANLRARVLNNWLLPDGKNVVILEATVNGNGDVLEVKTSESKADALAIEAATNAFEKSQPLGRLPSKYSGDCKITLTFTTNVDPHGDSTSDLTSRIDQISTGKNEGKQGADAQPAAGQ